MRWNKLIITIIFFILAAGSCIEPFVPETSDYVNTMFIEAIVSDHADIPHKVVISRTVPIHTQENINTTPDTPSDNISGANVTIHCDDGTFYQFNETGIGKYFDTGGNLTLEEGKQYKIVIETLEGNLYESPFEKFVPSPPIDSITHKTLNAKLTETSDASLGLGFYANTRMQGSEPLYVRYLMEETYLYGVPFFSAYIWDGSKLVEFLNDSIAYCYKTGNVSGIYVSTSEGLSENRVRNAPLHFVSQYGDKLMIKYSLFACQMSINKSAYRFWEELSRLLFETGGLYETQPFRISGNITCTSNPGINVMGVFEVAGVSTTRIFVPHPRDFRVYPEFCSRDTVGVESFPWENVEVGAYITEDDPGVFMTGDPRCFDCRERGGVIERPPFWQK
ncbi:MAG TPA: DUF4249 domain-containing protein [Bacteroidales bacterium]|nr:DUF4249 domain-containing protein [Bacteroidales bacterium]